MVVLFDSSPIAAAAATTVIGARLTIPCHLEVYDLLIRFHTYIDDCWVIYATAQSPLEVHGSPRAQPLISHRNTQNSSATFHQCSAIDITLQRLRYHRCLSSKLSLTVIIRCSRLRSVKVAVISAQVPSCSAQHTR
eukprot:TRINITY_DN7125_c0_g1_i4.p1 TRINITY_DN7125_c0_g1~~TRINITY_DN7125_c0_g1_i4.p1  ORF type:complete len:136 (-),score=9.43 TRINITY_DN7125_c0_g1_i4:219-626(-)